MAIVVRDALIRAGVVKVVHGEANNPDPDDFLIIVAPGEYYAANNVVEH